MNAARAQDRSFWIMSYALVPSAIWISARTIRLAQTTVLTQKTSAVDAVTLVRRARRRAPAAAALNVQVRSIL